METKIQIRVTPEERQMIKQASQMSYLSVSSYLRRLGLLEADKLIKENQGVVA